TGDLFDAVLVAGLSPDGFAFAQGTGELGGSDRHGLLSCGPEVHLDPALLRVPARFVGKVPEHEVAAQLAVDTTEEVEIERRRDAGRVVVGQYQVGHRLL